MQCPLIVRKPTTTSVVRRAQQQKAQVLRLLLRDSERSGALARATRKPADHGCALLERRITAASGRREASRRCSALAQRIGRPQPACHGTRAAASARGAPPPKRQRAQCRARSFHSEAGWFLEAAAGVSHYHRVPKKRGSSPVQCPYLAHESNTTSAARRARGSKLKCCASSRETASAVVHPRVPRESRLIMGAHRWHVAPWPHTDKERGLSPVQCPCLVNRPTTTNAARHARISKHA